jgi:hypothetical protein
MTLELPEDLGRDARELGISNQETIVELLRQEVDQRVTALVNAEIHAHRVEKGEQHKIAKDDPSPQILCPIDPSQ